jgi:GNAT superfamily N-acetyltransferase
MNLRPAEQADLPAIAALINAASFDVLGTPRALIDSHGKLRQARYVPEQAESIVAVDTAGRLVAYQYLASQPPYISAESGGALHPEYCGRGIGAALLGWAEQRSRQLLALAPQGARVVLQCHAFEQDARARALLLRAGFHQAREWIHLEIELQAPPPAPAWPEGASVRLFDPNSDWPLVGAALEEAFLDHWGALKGPSEEPQQEAEEDDEANDDADDDEDDPYSNSRELCFVALQGNQVAGSCLCNAMSIEWPASGKIGSLSVRRPFRGRGIGKALLYHALGAFYRRGTRRVVTDTDAQSFTGADRMYQRAGMAIFRREQLYEKVLRDGSELRLLAPAPAE